MDRLRRLPGSEIDPAEQRLSLLTDQCAEIVRRWSVTSERHARAVSQLEAHLLEWTDAGARLQESAAHRFQELEQLIHHEWRELRDLHQEPARQLHEHATSLTQVCIATANVVQQSVERSEARLASIEAEMGRRLAELSREVQSIAAELRASHGASNERLPASTWQLEGVTRLHNQLRQGDGSPAFDTGALQRAPAALPEASVLSDRLSTLERTIDARQAQIRDVTLRTSRASRIWRLALAGLAVAIVAIGIFAWRLRGDLQAAVERGERDARAASDAAAREVAAVREAAARDVKDAMERASRAQTTVDVLAAPDLLRYNLIGQDVLAGASAQLRWSRSRGVVFSALRMNAPPPGTTYQIWLLTRAAAVSAATFTPDDSGAATVSVPPPHVPRAVIGAMVTLEPATGSPSPTGAAVLARPPDPDPSPVSAR